MWDEVWKVWRLQSGRVGIAKNLVRRSGRDLWRVWRVSRRRMASRAGSVHAVVFSVLSCTL